MISETMLGERFPEGQCLMDKHTPQYKMNRNVNGGGIALPVREDVPSRQILFKNNGKDIQHSFLMKLTPPPPPPPSPERKCSCSDFHKFTITVI